MKSHFKHTKKSKGFAFSLPLPQQAIQKNQRELCKTFWYHQILIFHRKRLYLKNFAQHCVLTSARDFYEAMKWPFFMGGEA